MSFERPGLYEVSLLFSANAVGQSGLEFYWHTARTPGLQVIPQAALYTSVVVGQQLITFEELPVGTVPSDQFRDRGVTLAVLAGDVQVTNAFPAEFVPVTQPNVLASPTAAPPQGQVVEMRFVVPGRLEPGITDLVQFFVIDADSAPGTRVVATNQHGQTVFDQRIVTGGAGQQQVTISAPKILKVGVELGGAGADTAALDNLAFNTPVAADLIPPKGKCDADLR